MRRQDTLQAISAMNHKQWDIVVIGGGATGLGIALDAAVRGYTCLLIEKGDFAQGTSSKSTKLIHGGVRYLAQGKLSLVHEALTERELLWQNAPHLCKQLTLIVPAYSWAELLKYAIGLTAYDLLGGRYLLGRSRIISAKETLKRLPNLITDGLKGGIIFHDGQFNDTRMAISLAQTASTHGAHLINHCEVTSFIKDEHGKIQGLYAEDKSSDERFEIRAKTVINATGPLSDLIRKLDMPNAENRLKPSQGTHLVLDQDFLPSQNALLIPKTSDKRLLFAIPWQGATLLGTTDTCPHSLQESPKATEEEIDFLLKTAGRYLTKKPKRSNIKTVFAGLRPLFSDGQSASTSRLSRSHHIESSASGLISVTGGKWTTYRKMAEDTLNYCAQDKRIENRKCLTKSTHLHGYTEKEPSVKELADYGSEATRLEKLIAEDERLGQKIHPDLPYLKVQVVWAVREEMALTLEDVLGRRLPALFIDSEKALEASLVTAEIMAMELQKDHDWILAQIASFKETVKTYSPSATASFFE